MIEHPVRILIVEDLEENRQALKLLLQLSGFVCLEAADGRTALQTATQAQPDLVLMDITLPDMNGLAVIEQLRARAFKPPIIVVSAYDDEASQQKARAVGANDYLTKPIEFDRLKKMIAKHLA